MGFVFVKTGASDITLVVTTTLGEGHFKFKYSPFEKLQAQQIRPPLCLNNFPSYLRVTVDKITSN